MIISNQKILCTRKSILVSTLASFNILRRNWHEKKGKELSFIFRTQFSNTLSLLHDSTDPNILHLILKGTEKLIPCALTHRKFMKNLIKFLANLWSTQSHDQIRNSIYSIIEKIFSANDKNYIEYSLKVYTFYIILI